MSECEIIDPFKFADIGRCMQILPVIYREYVFLKIGSLIHPVLVKKLRQDIELEDAVERFALKEWLYQDDNFPG